MNEANRTAIILLAALWIVAMAVVIFVTWAADAEAVERLQDFVQYLDDHRDDASRLILTLGALVLIVLALLLIIVELAPEEETREIRVEQAGATTIVPAEPLRLRLEQALTAITQVTEARARVYSHDKGIGMKLDLTVTPGTNVAIITQEAARVVAETIQADLGIPVTAPPTVRITFGPPKEPEPVASSITQPPTPEPPSPAQEQPGAPPTPAPEPPQPFGSSSAAPGTEQPAEPAQPTGERGTSVPPEGGAPEEPAAGEDPRPEDPQQH